MPRRNINARERTKTVFHGATRFHSGYRPECVGCLFVGHNFSCTTSDGECLITHKGRETKTARAWPEPTVPARPSNPEDKGDGKGLCNTGTD
jgi:hypothetical protein